MAKTFEEYRADADKQNAEAKKKALGSIDSSADAAIKLAEDTYKKAEANTVVDYASEYERNAVQKLINEKKIAERNANLGLTDSGLNRTQQTAVQLSYANQKGKIDLSKQQALDKLSSDLASYVTGINNQREADKLSVNQFYDQQNNTIATEMYNTDVNAGVELQKAAIEANNTKGASFSEFNKINEEINSIFEDGNLVSIPWVSKKAPNLRKKAAQKIYTYYVNGFIDDVQKQTLINEYGLEDYFSELLGKNSILDKYDELVVDDPQASDYADWNKGDWEGYFAQIRQSEGRAAAEEELTYFTSKGLIPKEYVNYGAIGARGGSVGH